MSDSSLVAIAGIVATLLGALGGSWLTARATSGAAKEDRLEARREALRDSIARTIVALKEWGTAKHTNNLFLATLTSSAELKQYMQESVDSWTMERLTVTGEELRRALTQAKLMVADTTLLRALVEVEHFQSLSGESMFKKIAESIDRGEDSTRRAALTLAMSDRYDNAVKELENAARELLAEKVVRLR